MSFDPAQSKSRRDFVHTTAVHFASALAADDLRNIDAGSRAVRHRFDFVLLAAATDLQFEIVDGELMARGGGLRMVVDHRDGELHLDFQLVGYANLKLYAGSEARLTSTDGAIDHPLRFNLRGEAKALFRDTPEMRTSMTRYRIEIYE